MCRLVAFETKVWIALVWQSGPRNWVWRKGICSHPCKGCLWWWSNCFQLTFATIEIADVGLSTKFAELCKIKGSNLASKIRMEMYELNVHELKIHPSPIVYIHVHFMFYFIWINFLFLDPVITPICTHLDDFTFICIHSLHSFTFVHSFNCISVHWNGFKM